MTHLEGQNFAGYEILTKLGQGGMGAVYKARQPLLSRIVALKVMAEQISSDPDYVARFIREAASAANLRHPNIVEVFTAGEQNGMYFMAMEFVEGESLRKRLDRLGRIPPQEAVAVTIYVAQALQHAWNKTKLIHRDIKPDNIFLSDAGEVKVGDLGLAKTVGSENTDLTQSGMMMGSPHYISPEQAQAAKDIDFRTDIYSLGCTLYHMLTGKTPYTGDSSMAVIMKHVHEPAPAIFKTWPQCPMPLGMLVGRMLAKDRAARPQSYEQLVAELFAVSEKLQHPTATVSTPVTSTAAVTQPLATTSSAPTRALQPSAKPKSLKVIYAAAGVAVLLALGGLLLWSPWKTEQGLESRLQAESGATQPAKAGTPNPAASDAFVREVAALPAEQQVKRVMDRLAELNPGFNLAKAEARHEIENGTVTSLAFLTCNVTDISPVRALTGLRTLIVHGGNGKHAPLEDISPLRGLKIESLICYNSRIRDLSALQGMPLTQLQMGITDVEDLSPLRGMPLRILYCHKSAISDLSPLANMPLKELRIEPALMRSRRNRDVVRGLTTLEKINSLPAAGFWKQVEATGPKLEQDAALKQLGSVYKNSVGAEMVYIPPGEFMLGSTKEEQEWSTHYGTHINYVEREGEQPRKATIRDGFWIGRTELTVGQWKEFVAATGYQTTAEKQGYANYALRKGKTIGRQDGVNWKNPGFDAMPQDNHPVCCVTWNDAMAYCAWLTERERQAGRLPAGFVVRLPTEAEWEYACRAGTQSKFWWGESLDDGKGRLNRKGAEDGFEYVAPVDAFGARGRNKFGLADMLGNLCEFCLDDFDDAQAHGEYYTAQLRSHALRGASFNHEPGFTRCAIRTGNPAASACAINGFRLCVGVEMPAPATATRPSTVNLLPRIDLQRDAMSGTWFFEAGALVSSGNVNVLLELPYEPPQEYDFEIEFTIEKTGSAVAQRLSKSDCCFLWVVGGYGGKVFGFDTVGERWANQNPTRRDLDLPVGRRNTSVVKVRNDHVSASLNGSEISKWKTDYRDLAMPPWWRPRDPSLLGVASFNGRVVFHRIEVREVTGKGMFTRSEPPPSPTVEAFQRIASTYTNAAGGEMVYIPPGEFMLGSTKEERAWATANGWPENVLKREGEQPRKTTIRQGFWMGRTEVTVGQWKKFVSETHYITDGEKKGESSVMQKPGNRPVDVKGASWKNPHFGFRLEDNHPVCCVSWNDAVAFCRWLTDQERRAKRLPQGCEVRLPTEAEWEYACRAGSQDKCWWGDNPDDGKGRLNWDGKEDGFEYVAPVDSFGARGRNRFGLADMLGNVFEWCLDGYDPTQAHADAWADNTNARVLRGGAFDMRHESCRCAWRHSGSPSSSGCARGFRVVVAGAVFCQKSSMPPASPAPASQGTNDTFSKDAINLLPLIDPQKDAVEGTWRLTSGELNVAGSDYARLQIPYQPPAEYDFRIVFTRQQGCDAIWQILTGGGHGFRYCLDGWNGLWFGFDMISKNQARENPCGVRMERALENGRRYTSLVQVRKGGVKGFLDDHFVTEWKTNYQDMSLQGNMQMRDEQSLGVGAHRSVVAFHRIEVREITGKGTFTRGGSSRNTDSRLIGNVYTNAVGGEMVAIPPGEFLMGSTPREQAWAAERVTKPQVIRWEGAQPRRTAIKSGFWMGRTEVTVGQFKQFVQATGYRSVSETRGVGFSYHRERQRWDLVQGACWRDLKLRRPTQDNDPATCIEWSDAAAFCDWLNEREQAAGRLPTGCRVRLPTEAEWEYACRAGTQTKYWWGDDEQDGKGRLNWLQSNSAEDFPEVVDHYGPRGRNRFGLADILGNAREWCFDGFDPTGAHEQPCLDNTQGKVGRGGSFGFNPPYVRCASRDGSFQGTGHARQGFRVCCGVDVPGGRTGLPPATSAAEAAYFNEVAALPAEQQVARVVEELKKRNPGYDGKKTHKIQDGKVIELELWTEHISDISPVRSLSSLQNFYCTGPTDERNRPTGKKGMLADLSPLKGMHLTRFKCRYNHISDLSSLAGMAINYLESECNGTVCDLSPLERMPLTWLRFDKHLLQQGRNREILRNIRTLERINGIAAAEFWKKADTGEVPKP